LIHYSSAIRLFYGKKVAKTLKAGYRATSNKRMSMPENGRMELINKLCELLQNETMIKNSLVLPFRFLTAYEQFNTYQNEGT
jgi:hypothetical protein